MKLYRVLEDLNTGSKIIRAGVLSRVEWLPARARAQLLAKEHIAEVAAPPLEVLPGWGKAATLLERKLGITDSLDFVELDDEVAAKALSVSTEEVQRRKREVLRYLTVDGLEPEDLLSLESEELSASEPEPEPNLPEEALAYLLPEDDDSEDEEVQNA